eukprot:Gb_37250 [translate_table: standard]
MSHQEAVSKAIVIRSFSVVFNRRRPTVRRNKKRLSKAPCLQIIKGQLLDLECLLLGHEKLFFFDVHLVMLLYFIVKLDWLASCRRINITNRRSYLHPSLIHAPPCVSYLVEAKGSGYAVVLALSVFGSCCLSHITRTQLQVLKGPYPSPVNSLLTLCTLDQEGARKGMVFPKNEDPNQRSNPLPSNVVEQDIPSYTSTIKATNWPHLQAVSMEDQQFNEANTDLVVQERSKAPQNTDNDRVIDVSRNEPPLAKNKSTLHKQEVRANPSAATTSMTPPHLATLMKKLPIEVVIRSVVFDTITHWQIFDDKELIHPLLWRQEEFKDPTVKEKDLLEENFVNCEIAKEAILQLKYDNVPRGLISFESSYTNDHTSRCGFKGDEQYNGAIQGALSFDFVSSKQPRVTHIDGCPSKIEMEELITLYAWYQVMGPMDKALVCETSDSRTILAIILFSSSLSPLFCFSQVLREDCLVCPNLSKPCEGRSCKTPVVTLCRSDIGSKAWNDADRSLCTVEFWQPRSVRVEGRRCVGVKMAVIGTRDESSRSSFKGDRYSFSVVFNHRRPTDLECLLLGHETLFFFDVHPVMLLYFIVKLDWLARHYRINITNRRSCLHPSLIRAPPCVPFLVEAKGSSHVVV